jgi:hypothetical protein
MGLQYNLVRREEGANITVVVDGEMFVADDNHPLFDEIVDAAIDNDESVVDLFDTSHRVSEVFANLSERVRVANSRVYVDGFEVNDVYADTLVSYLESDVTDDERTALVNFLEKVYSNVSDDIRENLSRWLKAEQFTLLPNGNILGYRGLNGDYTSRHAGPGIVNGEKVNGHLDNSVGNVLEMDAAAVEHNPSVACGVGLHVGTHSYASGWAGYGGVVVSVEVDPRHVRSVPYDCNGEKMRVSKYTVKETVTAKKDDRVFDGYDDAEYDEYDDDDEGDYYY